MSLAHIKKHLLHLDRADDPSARFLSLNLSGFHIKLL